MSLWTRNGKCFFVLNPERLHTSDANSGDTHQPQIRNKSGHKRTDIFSRETTKSIYGNKYNIHTHLGNTFLCFLFSSPSTKDPGSDMALMYKTYIQIAEKVTEVLKS